MNRRIRNPDLALCNRKRKFLAVATSICTFLCIYLLNHLTISENKTLMSADGAVIDANKEHEIALNMKYNLLGNVENANCVYSEEDGCNLGNVYLFILFN